MFNILSSSSDLFILTLLFFIVFMVLRRLLKNKVLVCLYHVLLFCVLFIFAWAGGGVQNDGYSELHALEKRYSLELAERNKHDSTLQNEIKDLKEYLKSNDVTVDKIEAVFIAWLLAFIAEISMLIASIINRMTAALSCYIKRKRG